MSLPYDDISPTTIEGIISINVFEESSVFEILQELKCRFPDQDPEALRQRTREWLEIRAHAGAIGFFRRKWPEGTMTRLSKDEGIARLRLGETWVEQTDDPLVAYETAPDQATAHAVIASSGPAKPPPWVQSLSLDPPTK